MLNTVSDAETDDDSLKGDDDFWKDQPSERRLGKGGVAVFYAGGVHHNGRGGGGGCNHGWCNVQDYGKGCMNYCRMHQCYKQGHQTYRCANAYRASGSLLQLVLAAVTVGRL